MSLNDRKAGSELLTTIWDRIPTEPKKSEKALLWLFYIDVVGYTCSFKHWLYIIHNNIGHVACATFLIRTAKVCIHSPKVRPPGIEPGSPRPQRGVLPLNQRRLCSVMKHVPVAQWLRRVTTNHEIGGSSPSRNVSFYWHNIKIYFTKTKSIPGGIRTLGLRLRKPTP